MTKEGGLVKASAFCIFVTETDHSKNARAMNLQYLSDHTGHITGVFIPIEEWESIRKKLDLPDTSKQLHREELLEAFEEVKLIREGKLPKPSLTDFLNEL